VGLVHDAHTPQRQLAPAPERVGLGGGEQNCFGDRIRSGRVVSARTAPGCAGARRRSAHEVVERLKRGARIFVAPEPAGLLVGALKQLAAEFEEVGFDRFAFFVRDARQNRVERRGHGSGIDPQIAIDVAPPQRVPFLARRANRTLQQRRRAPVWVTQKSVERFHLARGHGAVAIRNAQKQHHGELNQSSRLFGDARRHFVCPSQYVRRSADFASASRPPQTCCRSNSR